ncbi:MAG: gamma-glutamylcyclotransferase [Deltaproteobacteria bacterium]|nr:gamma-glutamylcyclotransferase [Deltaproteobacteria bacterium]
MAGQDANALLAGMAAARRVGPGWFPGMMVDLGDYPGAFFDSSASTRVQGELWEVEESPAVFRALDEYEEEGRLFVRRRIQVYSAGSVLDAWTYLLRDQPPGRHRVPGGDWREHRA